MTEEVIDVFRNVREIINKHESSGKFQPCDHIPDEVETLFRSDGVIKMSRKKYNELCTFAFGKRVDYKGAEAWLKAQNICDLDGIVSRSQQDSFAV